MKDWTHPPLSETPGDLSPALAGAILAELINDREHRTVKLRFDLPPDAGALEARLLVEGTTHLLAFAYLAPIVPLPEGLSPEEAVALVGSYAREGLIQSIDPAQLLGLGTPLTVSLAYLHTTEEAATLTIEGYGEDSDRIVWWEIRAAGRTIEAK